MKIVKLNAIDSTNAYLRDLIKRTEVEDATVVVAHEQLKGKGQGENIWTSERGKNLTFSVLIRFDNLSVTNQHYLNYSISLALYSVLRYYIPNKLSVKWPNDILSAGKKICGVLSECVIKSHNVNYAIVGIGLNVNQQVFPDNLTNVTSLRLLLNKDIDKDELLEKILWEIQFQIIAIKKQEFNKIKQQYEAVLFKKGVPSMFKTPKGNEFLGKIIGTSKSGNLIIQLEDESFKEFGQKAIKFV